MTIVSGPTFLDKISQQNKNMLFASSGIVPPSQILIILKTKREGDQDVILNKGTRAQAGTRCLAGWLIMTF